MLQIIGVVAISITLIELHKLYTKANELYANTTQDRRDERLRLVFFCGKWYYPTRFTFSRAYESLLSDLFGGRYLGIIFEAVIVVPICDIDGVIYTTIGTRSENRRINWIFDMGASGLCSADKSVYENAVGELYEELGLKLPISYYTCLMPVAGYGVIMHIYICNVNMQLECKSIDGTYSKISWVLLDRDNILNYMHNECAADPSLVTHTSTLVTRNLRQILNDAVF